LFLNKNENIINTKNDDEIFVKEIEKIINKDK